MSKHILQGLEPDNLLAFLALLGFHRAVTRAEPNWHPRVFWDKEALPLRPSMVLSKNVSQNDLLEVAARGCKDLASVHEFGEHENIDYTADQARTALREACEPDRRRIDLMSALMCDAAVKDDGTVRATPLCAMFGQGHQNFLQRLKTVSQGLPPKELAKEVTPDDLNAAFKLEQTLFHRWERNDRTQSFRWDPVEDRRYALRFADPSSEKGLTVHGANRLASLALPLLTCVPKRERSEIRLYAIGTSWADGCIQITWPIWSRPASLASVIRLVSIGTSGITFEGLGISHIYRAERISVGKFFSFTRALPSIQPSKTACVTESCPVGALSARKEFHPRTR